MPAAGTFESIANVQQAIAYRKNSMMVGGGMGMRTAICPRWDYIGIDDIYTGSASGTRFFTIHVLLGDVILVQPDAYAQIPYQLA